MDQGRSQLRFRSFKIHHRVMGIILPPPALSMLHNQNRRRTNPSTIRRKSRQRVDVSSTDFRILPIPKRLRYDPDKPCHFGLLLNVSFGFAFEFSKSFDVAYSEVSVIPTLIQAGRQLILLFVLLSTTLTIGLGITPNLRVFEVLCYLISVANVTPQIFVPLAADLATLERRASAMSVVLSGFILRVLTARVLAGFIGNFDTWRTVPSVYNYPAKDRDLTYFKILYTMAKYVVTEPLVIQTALINIASSACFSSLWVALTFLLGGPPYHYSILNIGLFGLVGMCGVLIAPFTGRLIDNLVPCYATLVAPSILLVCQSVGAAAGGINLSAVIIASSVVGCCSVQVYPVSDVARARLNAILILSFFTGQVMGTSVGTRVFVQHGWRACALFMLALYSFQLGMLVLRGPHCPRDHWFGWTGGFGARESVVEARKRDDVSKAWDPMDEA
ncbi:hypothetical protein HD554DRAFT_2040765 [Boletus coccyginus]|nr:hypothetical protein HD554DRAFT_2040765 [Boletus coccyginus]